LCGPDCLPHASSPRRGWHNPWYHTCKPCFLGIGWRRQLCPAQYPGLGDCWTLIWAGESLYIEAAPLVLRPCLRSAPEVPLTSMSGHHMGSVDSWLCQNIHQIFGGCPAGYPRFGVLSRRGLPPLETRMYRACFGRQRPSSDRCGPRLEELSGGNWNGRLPRCALYCVLKVGDWGCFSSDPLLWYSLAALVAWAAALSQRCRRTTVTWLILPVVICLSQRLSHACLSISNYTVKLRMAH
jgi:hypothetical protein